MAEEEGTQVMDTREALADYAHDAWSRWMRYLFGQASKNVDYGTRTISAAHVERWTRQMNTPYADLPEHEKESDRKEADQILAIVGQRSTVPEDMLTTVCNALLLYLDVTDGCYCIDCERGKYTIEKIMTAISRDCSCEVPQEVIESMQRMAAMCLAIVRATPDMSGDIVSHIETVLMWIVNRRVALIMKGEGSE